MSKGKSKKSLSKEFNQIVKLSKFSFELPMQWNKNGDRFEKFTMYEEYTPVQISDRTTLVREL